MPKSSNTTTEAAASSSESTAIATATPTLITSMTIESSKPSLSIPSSATTTTTPQKTKVTVEDFLLLGDSLKSTGRGGLEKSKSNTELEKQLASVKSLAHKDTIKKGKYIYFCLLCI